MKCPICKGSGEIESPKLKIDLKHAARVLTKSGYSRRQVAKMLGLKSANSVQHHLK